MEMVEVSTSETRMEHGKGSVAKVKAMPKRTTVVPRNPVHLCGPLTHQVDLVCTWLMEICGAIQALEVKHKGLLIKITKIMKEFNSDNL